jgi:hypothetical protein
MSDLLDNLIQEGEDQLKHYKETKESFLSDPNIPDKLKEAYIGLGEALKPMLELLYKEKNIKQNEQLR